MSETFVPYSQRAPQTDDLTVLRDELVNVTSVYGRGSSEAREAFERLFRASCRLGRPLDGLRQFSPDEHERFFAFVVNGTEGHAYWIGGRHGFYTNEIRANGKDRRVRPPRRWWYEHANSVALSPYADLIPTCGERECIAPNHCTVGREVRRRLYTDDQMIGALQVYAMRHGQPPSTSAWDQARCLPGSGTYVVRFGSWEQAIAAAGLTEQYKLVTRNATKERALASMMEAMRVLGHPPGYDEFRTEPLHSHLKAKGLLTSPMSIRRQLGPSWEDVQTNTLKAMRG